VKYLGRIAASGHLGGNGLVKAVGYIVKDITAGGGKVDACVHTELRIQGSGTTVAGGVEVGEIDTLVHHAVDGGRILWGDHPIVHGLHEHHDHILSGKCAGHSIVSAFSPLGKVSIYFLLLLRKGGLIGRGEGVELVHPNVPQCKLIDAGNIIDFFGIVHGVVGGAVGRGLTVFRMCAPNVVVPLKYQLRKQTKTNETSNTAEQIGEFEEQVCRGMRELF